MSNPTTQGDDASVPSDEAGDVGPYLLPLQALANTAACLIMPVSAWLHADLLSEPVRLDLTGPMTPVAAGRHGRKVVRRCRLADWQADDGGTSTSSLQLQTVWHTSTLCPNQSVGG